MLTLVLNCSNIVKLKNIVDQILNINLMDNC